MRQILFLIVVLSCPVWAMDVEESQAEREYRWRTNEVRRQIDNHKDAIQFGQEEYEKEKRRIETELLNHKEELDQGLMEVGIFPYDAFSFMTDPSGYMYALLDALPTTPRNDSKEEKNNSDALENKKESLAKTANTIARLKKEKNDNAYNFRLSQSFLKNKLSALEKELAALVASKASSANDHATEEVPSVVSLDGNPRSSSTRLSVVDDDATESVASDDDDARSVNSDIPSEADPESSDTEPM